MKWDHIVKNGTIVTGDTMYKADVYIKDGKIGAVTTDDLGDAAAERVTEFQTGNDAVAALSSGKVDAVIREAHFLSEVVAALVLAIDV